MRDQLFHFTPEAGSSLQSQLRTVVVRAILDGHIPPGDPLPSCRRLARQLGVARNTVVLAYQHLVDEGYLISRERSGYFVNPDIVAGRVAGAGPEPEPGAGPAADRALDPAQGSAPDSAPDWGAEPARAGHTRTVSAWAERLARRPSRQRNIAKPADWQRYPYPFIYGQFDPALFPVADWRECAREALSRDSIRRWAADSIDRDDPMLVEQIHTRVLPRRGVWASPDEILVTVGAQHALYLLATLLVSSGTTVGLEDPGYPDARNLFALMTRRLVGLEVDGEGLVPGPSLRRCQCVYVTPSHQYPTTATMSLERRRALLARAAREGFVLIEDDYESEFNYVGEPTPALKSLDDHGCVIYVGSLSKTLAPGLRLGFLVGPPELVREARALRRLMLRHPPANNQRAVALFLRLGHHDSLVRRLSHAYRERWQAMGEALARHLPDSARMPTFGGTSYWVRGPAGLDAVELRRRAAAEGILIEPGDVNFLAEDGPRNFFRLGFSSIPVDRIAPGIERLARLVREAV